MKVTKSFIIQKHNSIFAVISFFCALLFIFSAKDVKQASIKSIYNCIEIIIPSVFPMIFFATFITGTGFSQRLKARLHKPISILFGIDGGCLEAMLTGLTGGYNVALKTACALYEKEKTTAEAARRCALFFTSPGLAFTVAVAGISLYNDVNTGIRFYVITTAVSLLTAIIYNIKHRNYTVFKGYVKNESISEIFINSVSSSSNAVISICFSIVLFSVLTQLLYSVIPIKPVCDLIRLLAEVSSAIIFSSSVYHTSVTLFCLAFAGFCIFIQSLPDLKKLDIRPLQYFKVRLLQAALCGIAELIYTSLFPSSVAAVAHNITLSSHKGTAFGSVALIFMCLIFLWEAKSIKRIKSPRQY